MLERLPIFEDSLFIISTATTKEIGGDNRKVEVEIRKHIHVRRTSDSNSEMPGRNTAITEFKKNVTYSASMQITD